MKHKNHLALITLFLLSSLLVMVIGQQYQALKTDEIIQSEFSQHQTSVQEQILTLIEEKRTPH